MSMPHNFSKGDAPIDLQASFWNHWNADQREHHVADVSIRRAEVVLGWLERIGRRNLDIS
jgi:hypothetical protein